MCPICYVEMDGDECTDADHHKPVLVHGAHLFGSSCIQSWLSENNSCPSCRQELFDVNTSATSDSEDDETLGFWETIGRTPPHLRPGYQTLLVPEGARAHQPRRDISSRPTPFSRARDAHQSQLRIMVQNLRDLVGEDDMPRYQRELSVFCQDRLEDYLSGRYAPPPWDYALYLPTVPYPIRADLLAAYVVDSTALQLAAYVVDGTALQEALHQHWRSALEHAVDSQVPTAASHPLAAHARKLIFDGLAELDGRVITAFEVRADLLTILDQDQLINDCFDLVDTPAVPVAFNTYYSDLVNAVVRKHEEVGERQARIEPAVMIAEIQEGNVPVGLHGLLL